MDDDDYFIYNLRNTNHPNPCFEVNKKLNQLVKTDKNYLAAISFSHRMELDDIKPNIVSFNILINCYCLLRRMGSTFSIFGKIFKMGYYPGIITLNTLMKGLCLHGRINEAKWFHKKLVAHGYELNHLTYGTLINALCKRRETGAAIQLLRQAERENVSLNVVLYNTIIDSLCKENRVTDAFDLYNEMVLKYKISLSPNVVTYNTLINGLCIAGQLKEAYELLNKMVSKYIKPDVYTFDIMVEALCKEGKVDEAQIVIDEMMVQVEVEPDVVIFNSFMHGCFVGNQPNKAKDTFDSMDQRGVTPDIHSYSYTIMIKELCKIKRVDEASNLFEEIRSKNMTPDAKSTLVLLMVCSNLGETHVLQSLLTRCMIKDYQPMYSLRVTRFSEFLRGVVLY